MYCLLDHPIYLKRVGIIKMLPETEDRLEHSKNVLRLAGRIIEILIATVELYLIQKQIENLVSLTVLAHFIVYQSEYNE